MIYSSNAIHETVEKPAQKQGTKRNSDQLEKEDNKSIAAPSKKLKTTEEAPMSTPVRVAPRPVSKGKKPAAAQSKAGDHGKISKKRSILPVTDDEGITTPEDPKTPAPPLKKPRVNKNDQPSKGKPQKGKPQPIRRTGIISLILKC